MNKEEPKYVVAVCEDCTSSYYIPFALHIQRNDDLWPQLQIDDMEAAKLAERDGVSLIYGMDDVEDGVYLDTPENRNIIEASLEKYPEYKLVKQCGCIPDTEDYEADEIDLFLEEYNMPYYNAKHSKEPQTVESLTEKLTQCKELQETMKEVNAYWRVKGTCVGAPGITEEQAKKLDNKIATTRYSWEKQPFSSYDLTNNNSTIKRLESKLKEVSKGFSGWEFDGGRAEANTEINRLQLFFDEKPDRARHDILRHAGFVHSYTNNAYQRQLNDNAIYAAGRLDFVKPSDGRTVREHQPKAPAKDTGAR